MKHKLDVNPKAPKTAEIELYEGIVAACERYGFLTDYSYDLIQDLMSSLQNVPGVEIESEQDESLCTCANVEAEIHDHASRFEERVCEAKQEDIAHQTGTELAITQAKALCDTVLECRATDATINLRVALLEFLAAYGVEHNAS